ncbi:hypothetical protein BYT27DRAFT_7083823 [Phlegmacium glaucopus]|nr:hypothetical protein BYT27DRAFT_7083823 [Phlegmacium glaucopus]
MQHPTCTNIRIRSTADAHKIFGAVQQGLLHMVTRRLDAEERLALRSGCIYAWEERGPHSEITGLGIERFTEGRRWSPSRVRDEFLFYYEKYSPPADVSNIGNSAERHPPRDWDQLVKQTYSVWVETDKGRRKWHLTAYFTQATIDQLGTVDDIPHVRDIVVTDGMFKSTRVGKSRTKTNEHNRSDASRIPRTYAAYLQQGQPGTLSTNPVLMHEPYQRHDQAEYYQEQVESSAQYSQRSLSPASPTTSGQYFGDVTSYSGPSLSEPSNSYVDHRYPTSPVGASHSHYTSHYQPPTTDAMSVPATSPQNYSTPRTLSPPWANQDSYFYARHVHNGPASCQSAPPMSYDHRNSTPHVSVAPAGHSSQFTSPRPNHPNFTPSYSLVTSPPPPDYRGVSLAPLQIPPLHYPSARQCQTPPDSAIVMEDLSEEDSSGLAPLNELKRQGRYRREPLDEKTLRLLIAQSTPLIRSPEDLRLDLSSNHSQ